MHLKPKFTYCLELSRQELTTVGLALCGKLKGREQEARELNTRIVNAQERELAQELALVESILERVAPPPSSGQDV
jgi:hypothetical protein